jgi:hypothetical protein
MCLSKKSFALACITLTTFIAPLTNRSIAAIELELLPADVAEQRIRAANIAQEQSRIEAQEAAKLSPLSGAESETEQASCGSIDLTQAPEVATNPALEAVLNSRPPQQEDALWCASYSIADILGFTLRTPISPIHLATRHYEFAIRQAETGSAPWQNYLAALANNGTHMNGGALAMFAPSIRGASLCKMPLANSDPNLLHEQSGLRTISSKLNQYRASQRRIAETLSLQAAGCPNYLRHAFAQSMGNLLSIVSDQRLNQALDLVNATDPRHSLDRAINLLYSEQCAAQNQSIQIPADLTSAFVNFEGARKDSRLPNVAIDQVLAQKPVALSLSMGGIARIRFDHGISIWGRKFHNGRCLYLVRDSMGCSRLNDAHQELCEPNERGYWISREMLNESTYNLVHF